MGNPLVSVVLPFYNAPYLEEAIQSILNQTYEHFELILVNNASTDDSVKVAKRYASDPRITLIDQPRKGVVFAANGGIEAARGAYIARMDSDDISHPQRLELQTNLLLEDSTLGVVSGLIEYLGPTENGGFIHYVDWLNSIITEEQISLNRFVEFPIANPTLMVRRELFDQYGIYKDGDFPEDYELFLRFQSNNVKMKKIDKSILTWRDTESRLTRTDNRYAQESFFKVKAKYLAQWLKTNNPFHPKIYIWGAGRVSRRRSDLLINEGIAVVNYIDVKSGKQTLHYDNLPDKESAFIVSYVSNRGIREEIRSYLIQNGYIEGVNFILAA
ncbi:Glycosyl transferase family 2 [Ekhidna lutea]|uniref:Glycosyl transferase family 2 n=1 Tax=Ekhidna lutea TaxID=447679 RepID=A0A239H9S7_EKHLU|nr:glycosyltransferase family A protein [Ekhidna lutea]SNS77573.1 Glycosyl transferase family 2 [Ekhidna lutea]